MPPPDPLADLPAADPVSPPEHSRSASDTRPTPPDTAPSGGAAASRPTDAGPGALATTAWLLPLAVPAAIVQFFALSLPWLSSLEARRESLLVSLAVDRQLRDAVASAAAAAGGLRGLGVLALLLSTLWLVIAGARGALGGRRLLAVLGGRLGAAARRRAVLLAFLAAVLAGLVQLTKEPLARVVDVLIAVRPTGPTTYAASFLTELLALVSLAAIAGVTLAGLRRAASREAVRWAAARACLVAGAACLATTLACLGLAWRHDLGVTLAGVVGREPVTAGDMPLAVITADGIAPASVPDATSGLPHDPELGRRVAEFLDARRGLTVLADAAERYVMAERLAAFDPVGAQEAAWRAVQARGAARTAHALLFSLATAQPDARSLAITRDLATTPRLSLGPQALALLADALDHQGDPALADRLRGRLATAGSERLPAAPFDGGGARRPTEPRLAGSLCVNEHPYRGPVGSLPAELVPLILRPGERSPITFLLRLSAVSAAGPDGRVTLPDRDGAPLALVLPVSSDAVSWWHPEDETAGQ